MSTRAWFVTSARGADVPLDGPFISLDACEARCLVKTSRTTALIAFAGGRMPAYYVCRQFAVREIETRHLYTAEASGADAPAPAPVAAAKPKASGVVLPAIVHTYTRGGLLTLCKALELKAPSGGADRAAIIEHIEKELRKLERV